MNPLGRPALPVEPRIWSMVDKNGPNGCWLWTRAKTGAGYGAFSIGGRQHKAYRVIYTLLRGSIEPGLHMDHLCRNPACVNPDHLEPVTPKVNMLRGVSIQARNAVKPHCMRGHAFTVDNTYLKSNKARACKTCKRATDARKRAMHLSKNFHLNEFICRDGSPIPVRYLANVKKLATQLQALRDALGKPIVINSGYRTPSYNKGAKRSQHLTASAADIRVKGLSPLQLKTRILALIAKGKMLDGGVGLYIRTAPRLGWVHYDIGPARRWEG